MHPSCVSKGEISVNSADGKEGTRESHHRKRIHRNSEVYY